MATLRTLQAYLHKISKDSCINDTTTAVGNVKEASIPSKSNEYEPTSEDILVGEDTAQVICPSCGSPDLSYNSKSKLYSCQNCFEHDLAYSNLLNRNFHPDAFDRLSLLYDTHVYLSETLFDREDQELTDRERQIFDLLFDLVRLATETEVNQAGVSRYVINNNELSYRGKVGN